MLTVITPTTGKQSLHKLVESIKQQSSKTPIFHLLLWDDKREKDSLPPKLFNGPNSWSIVGPPGSGKNGQAPGSQLRAIGLMAANTPWVTLADDDVWWDTDHVEKLEMARFGNNWATTLRKIWSPSGELLGVDLFESVGDDSTRKVPYEMCDGNTMTFRREIGVQAAHLYRNTVEYNDDRLMYNYLKQNAGPRGRTGAATINHVCPDKLVAFFEENCSKE